MKRFAAGFGLGIVVSISLACAGAAPQGGGSAAKFELIEVNYDNSIKISDMTSPTVEIHPGWVIFDDPSWGERFMVPDRQVNWIRIEK